MTLYVKQKTATLVIKWPFWFDLFEPFYSIFSFAQLLRQQWLFCTNFCSSPVSINFWLHILNPLHNCYLNRTECEVLSLKARWFWVNILKLYLIGIMNEVQYCALWFMGIFIVYIFFWVLITNHLSSRQFLLN